MTRFSKGMLIILLLTFKYGQAQLILASKEIVCPNENFTLSINPKALNPVDFCVQYLNSRANLHYFKTCNQVTLVDAMLMAKIMNGNLATANETNINNYLFSLLPNDIHWIGLYQNTKSKNYNDPPNAGSGFEWMSGVVSSNFFWATSEPNNFEDTNPGKYVIQGCRKSSEWCDEDETKKYVGLIESKTLTIPNVVAPQILWETGETSTSIVTNIQTSKNIKVKITYGTQVVEGSIYIQIPEAKAEFSSPGGCNPYKWKPEIISNVDLSKLDISWVFGTDTRQNELKPEFQVNFNGSISGSVNITSTECNTLLLNKAENFSLVPMVDRPLEQKEVLLNETIALKPFNQGPFTYSWTPSTGLSSSDEYITDFVAKKDIVYKVKITDDFGCTVNEEFGFTIDPDLAIYIPTIFTPDENSINDVFEFVPVKDFYGIIKTLKIYNSWGELIYETKKTPFTWDGKNTPIGVYQYEINYTVLDKPYKKIGKVILTRKKI